MAKVQYLDVNGLSIYHGLITNLMSTEDAKAIKHVAIDGTTLKFYKVVNPASGATPDFSISLPQQDLSNLLSKITSPTAGDFVSVKSDGTIEDSGKKAADFATAADVGTLGSLTTTAKTSIVAAVNEVKSDAAAAAADSVLALSVDNTGLIYTLTQGTGNGAQTIGTINIPADMVVSSGTVATYTSSNLPTDANAPSTAGTYIVLTLANATNDKIYINVQDLIDIYTAQANATQVQLAVDSNNVISATIVAGSIGTTELANTAVTSAKLADDAVVTAKILNKNVTKAKLDDGVQASLGLADTALQESDFETITQAQIEALFSAS